MVRVIFLVFLTELILFFISRGVAKIFPLSYSLLKNVLQSI
ncbi:hypothetical protein LEP1GSC202_1922 [Leptospira yanagawae serovar Saopaulo str. Sao Paulo = ATCC 700523]|uniref:Uncharacterized protein n=1 Tax=Leptospira yanagawae serovar Saopaulo str. Sao Paulo = ATCC 700523 TaxID=1249483 RepID=A0A5E8HFT7_9LEPT|nr:hypothetical protein LEP1GSC202_1922 [Leptospira yanagawae serovar Saopaulo str. Sao Paulo = ATCC 700523]